jgi:hypothetical protein
MIMQLKIVSMLALVAACGAEASGQSGTPTHVVVVCTKTCDPAARREEFRRWADRALDRAGSRFEVWHAGGHRSFVAEVPARWPAPVTASRADFIAKCEERVVADDATAATDERDASGDVEVDVLGAPDLERAVRAGMGATAPAHAAVICDLSNSTLGVSCQPSTVQQVARTWLEHGGLVEGATFEVLVPGQSYDSARRIVERRVSSRALGARVVAALDAMDAVGDVVAHDRGPAGSALAETIHLAIDDLADRRGTRSLSVLSDLRQYTPRRWNFEKQIPSPAAFSSWLSREGLVVDLHGIEVNACGTHHMRGKGAGAFDARMARKVVELWSGVFRDAGAPDARMTSDCDASPRADVASR